MSEARVIACNNCGSRYKLPPTFQGSKVRCKNCSAAIDIESSIVAPAAPAAAKPKSRPAKEPAGKKPVAKATSRRSRSSADDGEGKRTSSSRRGRKVSGSRSRGRRGADEVEEKSKTPMMLGIGGGVVVLAVALFFILGGKDDPKPADQGDGTKVAKTDTESDNGKTSTEGTDLPPEEGAGEAEKVAKKDGATDGKAEEATGKDGGKTEEATAKKTPKKTAKKKGPKKKLKPGESSTPFDPATETEELVWADDVTDEEKKAIAAQVEDTFSDTSAFGMRAGRKLAANGRKAFPAIVNRLRTVDYSNQDQHLQAYALHKLLEQITMGRNVGYNPTIPVTQGAAWWNARTVKGWMRFWNNQVNEGDVEAWKKFMDMRKKKQSEEEEDF